MLKRTRTSSSDDDFITPKPSTKRPKIIKSKKMKTQITPPSSSAASSDLPAKGIQFLNYLKNDIAAAFSHDIIKNLPTLIDPKNLDGCTVDELAELKGFDERDGKFFKEWLECIIKIDHKSNLPNSYSSVYITLNGRYPSIYNAAKTFYNDKKISCFNILSHHVILRAKEEDKLPSMSNNIGSYTASHLCDSSRCLRKEHLELELSDLNASRKDCSGVILLVINDHIIDVSPCVHGSSHPKFKAGGDELEFSCRKVRVEKRFL